MNETDDTRTMWNTRYAAAAADASTVWSAAPNEWVARTVEELYPTPSGTPTGVTAPAATSRRMTAVDLGCGEGRNAMWLASRGWQTTGVDFSAAGIEVAAARSAARNLSVQWDVADATTWRAHSPVDLVVCAYLQLPEQQLRQALARAAEALAPGGRLLLIGHHVDNLTEGVGGPQRADILFSPDVLADAVTPLVLDSVERTLRPVETPDGIRYAVDATLIAHAG